MTDKLIKAPETEALLLADWLDEDACDLQTPRRAAAMLRTQHAEIAALKEAAADLSQPATNAAATALAGIQDAGTWRRGDCDEIIFTPRSMDVEVIDGTRLYSERELFALMSFPIRWTESAATVKYDTLDGLPPNAVNTKNPIMEFDDDAPAVAVYPALPMDQLWMQLPDQWRKAIDAQMQADSIVSADTHQGPEGPTISANWDQATDGSFVATIRVSGISSVVQAKADLQRMRDALSAPVQPLPPQASEAMAWGYHNGKEWLTTTDFEMVKAMIQASGLKVYALRPDTEPVRYATSVTRIPE